MIGGHDFLSREAGQIIKEEMVTGGEEEPPPEDPAAPSDAHLLVRLNHSPELELSLEGGSSSSSSTSLSSPLS